MQAHAVVKCLSAALMNSADDDAMFYVDAANVAAELIDEAVARLNRIGMGKGVKEEFPEYFCFDGPLAQQSVPGDGIGGSTGLTH